MVAALADEGGVEGLSGDVEVSGDLGFGDSVSNALAGLLDLVGRRESLLVVMAWQRQRPDRLPQVARMGP